MKRKLLALFTLLFAVVLGLGVLAACGDTQDPDGGASNGTVSINKAEYTLAIGQVGTLTATEKNGGGITWTTSDASVVAIQSQTTNGTVIIRAVKGGQADLTATSNASGDSVSCRVTVENIVVEIGGTGVADGKLQIERGDSVKLSAVIKKDGQPIDGTVVWSTSDDKIVSVAEDGTLTANKKGSATVYATRHGSSTRGELAVTVTWADEPTGYYELTEWEQNKITPNLWGYWVDANHEPQYSTNIKVLNAEYLGDPTGSGLVAGGITFSYENELTGANEHGVQLFYRSSKGYNDANRNNESHPDHPNFTDYDASKLLLEVNHKYLLKMDLTVSESGTITVNGTQVEVAANEKQSLEIPFEHTDTGLIYPSGNYTNVGSAVYLMMGANGTMVQKATVTIENVSWEEWDGQTSKLQTPTMTIDGRNVTVTDPNAKGAKSYTVGAFAKDAAEDDDPVYLATSASKTFVLNDSRWKDGDYDLRIRANGRDVRYGDSDWSDKTAYTVAHGAVVYDLKEGGSGDAKNDGSDTYYYSVEDGASVESATYNDGTITFKYAGNVNWYSVQLFYKNPSLISGTTYRLSFKLNAPAAGKIRINGTMFDLKQGDNDVEVYYIEGTGADGLSLNIQFGEPNADFSDTVSIVEGGTFVFSDLKWSKLAGSLPFGEQANAVNEPGTFYLWWDQGWNDANVMMKVHDVDYDAKTIHFLYSATGDNRYGAGVQLFYEHPGVTTGKTYKITLKITVSVDCTIRVCGQTQAFEAGVERTVVIYQAEPGNAGQYQEGATIAVLMGVESPLSNVLEAEVTIKDWAVEEAQLTGLSAPTGATLAADGTVDYTDPNASGSVDHAEIGLFSGDTLVSTQTIAKGGKIDDSVHVNGQYTVKLRLCGAAGYADSAWVELGNYTVTGGSEVARGTMADAVANKGRWYVWLDDGGNGSTATLAKAELNAAAKSLTVGYTTEGAPRLGFSVQLFYENPDAVTGKTYTFSLKVKLSVAGTITINDKQYTFTAGQEQNLSIVYTEKGIGAEDWNAGASAVILMGVGVAAEEDGSKNAVMAAEITLSDWSFEELTSSPNGDVYNLPSTTLQDDGIPADSTFYYYAEFPADGLHNAKFDHGVVTFDIAGHGNWHSNRIFYKSVNVPQTQTYTFTMKLESEVAGVIRINETFVTLTVGTNNITIQGSKGMLAMYMGEPPKGADGNYDWDHGGTNSPTIENCHFSMSDFRWTASDGTVYGLDGRIS